VRITQSDKFEENEAARVLNLKNFVEKMLKLMDEDALF